MLLDVAEKLQKLGDAGFKERGGGASAEVEGNGHKVEVYLHMKEPY